MGSVVTALLFTCGILAFLVSNPEVTKSIRGPVAVEDEETVVEDDEEKQKMLLILTAILDRLENNQGVTEEKQTIDSELSRRLIEQNALESASNYHGDDEIVRRRLGLPAKIVVENINVAEFDREFESRFNRR